ncbi:uncharacterized protein METZ01_LOCUS277962, partial [marine metagenome]
PERHGDPARIPPSPREGVTVRPVPERRCEEGYCGLCQEGNPRVRRKL